MPSSYVVKADQVLKKQPSYGTIGNAKRFVENKHVVTPGVGQYNLAGFKSFAKAAETPFEM